MAQGIIAVAVVIGLLLLGLAMVSRMSYTHMVNRAFRGKAKIVRLVVILALVFALVVRFNYVLSAGFLVYALSGPAFAILRKLRPAKI
jgi:phosphatidylserine synthase